MSTVKSGPRAATPAAARGRARGPGARRVATLDAVDPDTLDAGRFASLPQLYRSPSGRVCAIARASRNQGVYRHAWYGTQPGCATRRWSSAS
jgi:hypothetical protein